MQASLRPRQNPQQQVIVYPGSGAGQLSIAHAQPAIQKFWSGNSEGVFRAKIFKKLI